jgi:hypothetical protein
MGCAVWPGRHLQAAWRWKGRETVSLAAPFCSKVRHGLWAESCQSSTGGHDDRCQLPTSSPASAHPAEQREKNIIALREVPVGLFCADRSLLARGTCRPGSHRAQSDTKGAICVDRVLGIRCTVMPNAKGVRMCRSRVASWSEQSILE